MNEAANEVAISIPMSDCGLSIRCGRDGTWLCFASSTDEHAAINIERMAERMADGKGIIGVALRSWCEDRQNQAERIRAALSKAADDSP